MIIDDQFENAAEFVEFVNANNGDFQFIMYDNNNDNKSVQIVKASPIPKDFKYKVKTPKAAPKRPAIIRFGNY